jgi:hypothetical protein
MDAVSLQVVISGLAGPAYVLHGGFEFSTGVLLLLEGSGITPGTDPGRMVDDSVVLSTPGACDDFDEAFTEDLYREAISEYNAMSGRGLLVYSEALHAINPVSKIEAVGLEDRGMKFNIAADMTNAHMAVIAMCWLALRQRGFAAQLEAFDDMPDIETMTIGLPAEFQGRRSRGVPLDDATGDDWG